MYLSLWEQQSPMYTSLPLDSLCEHMFSIPVLSVSELCDTSREQGVCVGRVYVWRWSAKCCLLWLVLVVETNCQPAVSPAASHPVFLLHPAPSPSPRAKVERTLQNFSCQMSSRDAGQVDSSSWQYMLQSPGLFAPELSNYCFFSMKSTIMSKKTSKSETQFIMVQWEELRVKVTVTSNYTKFPVIAQWCWNKWRL